MIKGKHEYLAPRFQTALQTSKTFKKSLGGIFIICLIYCCFCIEKLFSKGLSPTSIKETSLPLRSLERYIFSPQIIFNSVQFPKFLICFPVNQHFYQSPWNLLGLPCAPPHHTSICLNYHEQNEFCTISTCRCL